VRAVGDESDKHGAQGTAAPCQMDSEDSTGLPFFRSWKSVYFFVLGSFVLWIALLVALTKFFS
jgi:hypothetical protein